uniref:TetR family transcriptional regulator n=1 Tax=Heterorhabditis bacteriophora TaxID=37862 RepID=A0A1I7W879_HETBA
MRRTRQEGSQSSDEQTERAVGRDMFKEGVRLALHAS